MQLLAELDCLNVSHCHRTVEVSVLGHFQSSSSYHCNKGCGEFYSASTSISKGDARELLNGMASASVSASQRTFYGRNSKEWTVNP